MSNRLLSPTRVALATLGVALTLLLSALDQTVVGVAMPRIIGEMHGLEYYAWVTTAYLVASTAMLPVAGKNGRWPATSSSSALASASRSR